MKRILIVLVFALAAAGCQSAPAEKASPAATPAPTAEAAKAAPEAEHEHAAPHGGTLVELGEEFAHLEIVLDAATGRLTAYALDGEAEKAVRVKTSGIEIGIRDPALTLKLEGVANSLTGETAGDTSEFTAQNDKLKGATRFEGTVRSLAIKGKQFTNVAFRFPDGNESK